MAAGPQGKVQGASGETAVVINLIYIFEGENNLDNCIKLHIITILDTRLIIAVTFLTLIHSYKGSVYPCF